MKKLIIPPPPLPIVLIVFLALFVGILHKFFAPPFGTDAWINFHGLLTAAVAVIGFGIWRYFWPSYPGCNLYFTHQYDLDSNGMYRGDKAACLAPSVGRVLSPGNGREWKYFCRDHAPTVKWMQAWMKEKKIQIDLTTLKMFRITEEGRD